MPDAYDRGTFQQLAELRLAEAKLLARSGHPSGAYYLAGYAIECALKAHIAAQFKENQIPNKKFVDKIYTHNLRDLIKLAGLETNSTAPGSPILCSVKDGPLLKVGRSNAATRFGRMKLLRL